ncbi:DUF2207 domain-containing protein [Microbacterium sp. 4R-513]|uniref:DUF2207 domain-containing protein n=1 Tax=Microbacterium sp. 4R-513 TaxID=2567934 RepID=UPI001F49BC6B|nr:DUF2207 domain-containing protein [Microbacterium sp. 4R-513]
MGSLLRRAAAAALAASVLALAACSGVSVTVGDDTSGAPVSTNVDDFTFTSLDVDYTLTRADDGTSRLEVVERFVAQFPEYDQNHGMRRIIPDSYNGVPLHPELVSITDGDGAARAQEVEHDDGAYSMTSRADGFVHGAQTYVFTYNLENVIGAFADTNADEFYWDVNGVDWAQPFGRITATLHLDSDLADAMTGGLACYHGSQGATDTCPITTEAGTDASTRVIAETGDVLPYETMTIAVGFEPGTFTPFDSSYLASPWSWLQLLAALGVVAGVVWAAVTRARRLRDDPGRPTIIAEYTPPARIDALESAVLLGRTSKAIPAEVLEQAVVGSIRIVEGEKRWFGATRLKAQLVDPTRADGDGLMLLDGLFPGFVPGDEYEFGRTDKSFSTAAQKILKAANSELERRGLRRKVSAWVRAWPIILTTLAGGLVFVFGMAALDASVDAWIPLVLIVAAFGGEFLAIALLSHKPLTALGAEVRDHLAGLKVFIEWAEADRIRMLQSPQGAERVRIDTTSRGEMLKLYEALLPYAVVFGQEKQWAKELAILYGEGASPGWYSGSSGSFNAAAFSAGIATLSTSASSSSSSGGSGVAGPPAAVAGAAEAAGSDAAYAVRCSR